MISQKSEIEYLQKKLKVANEKLMANRSCDQDFSEKGTEGKHKVEMFIILVIVRKRLARQGRSQEAMRNTHLFPYIYTETKTFNYFVKDSSTTY
jgi:hypothetical protein